MLVESASSVVVEAIVGCSLSEVALDGSYPLFQQSENLSLIPLHGLRIGKVEHGILVGHAAIGIAHVEVLLNNLREEAVLGREVRQLPQTGVEALFLHLLEHAHGVGEPVFGKLVVALPVNTEPACIEVDDVSRYLMLAQLTGDVETFLLREIGDTAHPRAKRPQGQHGRLARYVGVFIEYVLRFTEEHEEVNLLVGHEEALCTDVALSEVSRDRCRGVHKDAIATVGEVERHGFVHAVGLRSLRVGDADVHLLSHLVQRGERLATAVDTLAGSQRKDGIDRAAVVGATLDERERQQLDLRRVVINDVARLGKHTALSVLQDEAEGVSLQFQSAVVGLVCND